MSWFSNLAETYDKVSGLAGAIDNNGNSLLPPNHMVKKTDICIRIDGEGHFRSAEKSQLAIVIPCTEDSSSRTVNTAPHPLHEDLTYLLLDENRHKKYLELLEAWSANHPKVSAVYRYIIGGTLEDNLKQAEIQAEDKLFVRFSVEADKDDKTPNLWEDLSVAKAWQDYCTPEIEDGTVCYVTGEPDIPRSKHPKGINRAANGAKLISCNDETNYTYRGRFTKKEQANAIGTQASHKAHSMLQYLIETQGYKCDSQAVVAWSVEDGEAQADPFASTDELIPIEISADDTETESDRLIKAREALAADYSLKLRRALYSKGSVKDLSGAMQRTAVIAVDAATTGRMAVTFYQELYENEYLERIISWHESCRWWFYGSKMEYLSAPRVDSIIAAVYGEPKGEGYKKIQKQARERLLHHIVCSEKFDRSWVSSAANRVSRPFSYDGKDGSWDKWKWENAIGVACAITRRYYFQKEEEFLLELETTRSDRSYLFGRLLAIADRVESHARYLQVGKDDTDKRPTNAVRYMTLFTSKPMRTWKLIYDQLNPYIQRLNGAEWYQNQIDGIMSLFKEDEWNDEPLNGKYLLGYSLQRRALNKNKQEEKSNEPE